MMEQQWEMLRSVAGAYGVKLWILHEDSKESIEFDDGLRGALYENYDYHVIPEQIKRWRRKGRIYNAYDIFAMHYIIFQAPRREKEGRQFVMVGAFFEEEEKPDAVEIVEEIGLELYQVKTLKDYYCGIPRTSHLEKVIRAMVQMMFPEIVWKSEKTGISLQEAQKNLHIRIEPVSKMSLHLIEERYQCENDMLKAVAQGDTAKMEKALHALGKYQLEARNSNNLRNAKNNLKNELGETLAEYINKKKESMHPCRCLQLPACPLGRWRKKWVISMKIIITEYSKRYRE